MSRDAWERIDGFSPDDAPPAPACENCNDIGQVPRLMVEETDSHFMEWDLIPCPCQTKT